MIDKGEFDFVCRQTSDLDETLKACLRVEIASALGRSVSDMFPAFSKAFPETASVIQSMYSPPFVLFKKHMGVWLRYLAMESGSANVFFELVSQSVDVEGAEFEQDREMLPDRWKELYRYFSSFVVTESSVKPMNWVDTPFRYSARLSMERYCQINGLKSSRLKSFLKEIGSENISCWLLTDDGDALFIDEQRCDRKVYHVRRNDLEGYCVLDNPEDALDRYLAHFLGTRSSSGFDFR